VKILISFFSKVPIWLVVSVVVAAAAVPMCMGQGADKAAPPAAAKAKADGAVEAEVVTTPEMSFLELLEAGGLQFMIPIGLCSLLGLTIIIERCIVLRRKAIMPPGFMERLKAVFHHDSQDRTAGLEFCHADGSPISQIVAAAIRKLHKSEEAVERAIEDAGAIEVSKLRRFLRLLYGVSAVAPMIGLLGTVWGMIKAFQVAAVAGLGKAGLLAEGIYIALVTTLAGLVVAIPVLMFYYYFLGKIDDVVHEMNDLTVEFLDHYAAEDRQIAQFRTARAGAAEPLFEPEPAMAVVSAEEEVSGSGGDTDWSQD